jgi:hypothetical protein
VGGFHGRLPHKQEKAGKMQKGNTIERKRGCRVFIRFIHTGNNARREGLRRRERGSCYKALTTITI